MHAGWHFIMDYRNTPTLRLNILQILQVNSGNNPNHVVL